MNTDQNTSRRKLDFGPLAGALLSIAIIGTVAIAMFVVGPPEPPVIVPLLLLASVLVGAMRFGVWSGLAAAIAAFAAYNFLFVEPYFTLRVAHFTDIVTLAVFLLTAGLTGWLAGRLRDEADSASRRLDHLDHLASLTASLANAGTKVDALNGLVRQAHSLSKGQAIVLEERDGKMRSIIELPTGAKVEDESLPIAARAFAYNSVQPPAAYGSSSKRYSFYPAGTCQGIKHVLAVGFPDSARFHAGELDQIFRQMAAQASEALERIGRVQEAGEALHFAETERLRSGLLLSLSHDLRTPLAGILGAISSLREPTLKLKVAAKRDLLTMAEEETRRLSLYVEDLLTLTRLQAGLKPDLALSDANEIACAALERARSIHHGVRYECEIPEHPVRLNTDPALLEQVIFNLLDNAAKHAAASGSLRLSVLQAKNVVRISVTDNGPGIDPATAARIFDPMFRGSDSAGAGLGLAIVKSVVTVLGGSIDLVSPVDNGRGTSFVLVFESQK